MRSLRDIYQLSYEDAREIVESARWSGGRPMCPHCGCEGHYDISTRNRYRCKHCLRQYSVTSGTLLSSSKMTLKDILISAFVFARARKGIASTQMANLVGIEQKTAWRISGVFREAIKAQVGQLKLSGVVEIDGATFGGHIRIQTGNGLTGYNDRRAYIKRYNERCVVVVAKQRMGRTIPIVVTKESEAKTRLIELIEAGSTIVADQARGWNTLDQLFEMLRVNHTYTFKANNACTNNAESFFSGLRKMHDGTHHWISAKHMEAYACELAWKRDAKEMRISDVQLTKSLLSSCLSGHVCCYSRSAPTADREAA